MKLIYNNDCFNEFTGTDEEKEIIMKKLDNLINSGIFSSFTGYTEFDLHGE